MFFDVGKKVLNRNNHRELFNRSILFEELMLMLCGEWEKKKGIGTTQLLSYSDIIRLLGHYAFNSFSKPDNRLLEFDQYISEYIKAENKSLIINVLLGSGVLKVTDRITFTHKLFKEYCTAYHMVNSYPLSQNSSTYLDLINRDDWKEVFVFASGMFKDIENQDAFLDLIMKCNLPLYIECINAKSDLSIQLPPSETEEFVKRYLGNIVKTYTYIIEKYFQPLRLCFDPSPGRDEKNISEKKIRIVGSISKNGNSLNYWFERVMPNEEDVLCINKNQIAEYRKHHEYQALIERKNIILYGLNLKNSDREGDSGRKVAIDLIKEGVESILKEKKLIESKYLLCERVYVCKNKVKEIKDLSDLPQIYGIVEDMIYKVTEGKTNFVGYNHNGVDMFYLHLLLKLIIDNNIDYDDCLLPEEDNKPNKLSCWTWDLYSDAQKANRIAKFFDFHQLSYLDMVEANFPVLYQKFSRYLDWPYKTIVLVYLKEDKKKDMFAEPRLTYYYVAAATDSNVSSELRYFDSEAEYRNYEKRILNEISGSYLNQGKETHRLGYTQTGFTFTTTSNNFRENCPLSDFVYDSIKNSLEEVLGKL